MHRKVGENDFKHKKRHEAQYATRQMPGYYETLRPYTPSVHYTESILMAGEGNVKHNCTKMKFDFGKNVSPGQKETKDVTLTSLKPRDKIASQYADVVKLGSDASAAGGG